MQISELLEARAAEMLREDTSHMRYPPLWERLGGDWLGEQIRRAYVSLAERERQGRERAQRAAVHPQERFPESGGWASH